MFMFQTAEQLASAGAVRAMSEKQRDERLFLLIAYFVV
jgi:hypothetical protein